MVLECQNPSGSKSGSRSGGCVFVIGDGDDDVAGEASLSLHEASGRTHVLTTAAVQEPGVSPGGFGVGDRSREARRRGASPISFRGREEASVWFSILARARRGQASRSFLQ
ncbi:hypothetical protein CLOM_g18740 [Closterium sp. NIES-68]|nr:hypothetical protein CLOM_g18740 [Closterium sp. NIES-68]